MSRQRKSRKYTPEQTEFLRSKLADYMTVDWSAKNEDRRKFLENTFETFLQHFGHLDNIVSASRNMPKFRTDFKRWFYNASRFGPRPRRPTLATEGDDEAPTDIHDLDDDDASILAMLFNVHLGYTKITPFKVFAFDNAERLAKLVNEEMQSRQSAEKERFIVQRQVYSTEFKKLSQEDLDYYKREAEVETERNKQVAEGPTSPEQIYRNQRVLKDVLGKILGALIGNGRACIGKAIFHVQYTLLTEAGPYPHSFSLGSAEEHYTKSEEYARNNIAQAWSRWSSDQLKKEMVNDEAADIGDGQDSNDSIEKIDDVNASYTPAFPFVPSLFVSFILPIPFPHHRASSAPGNGLVENIGDPLGEYASDGMLPPVSPCLPHPFSIISSDQDCLETRPMQSTRSLQSVPQCVRSPIDSTPQPTSPEKISDTRPMVISPATVQRIAEAWSALNNGDEDYRVTTTGLPEESADILCSPVRPQQNSSGKKRGRPRKSAVSTRESKQNGSAEQESTEQAQRRIRKPARRYDGYEEAIQLQAKAKKSNNNGLNRGRKPVVNGP